VLQRVCSVEIVLDTRVASGWSVPLRVPMARGAVTRARRSEFDQFFLAHYDGIVRSVTFVCGDRERAADATQEAFIRAFNRWTRVRKYGNPAAWVRRIAINVTRDEHRSVSRRVRREELADAPQTELPGPDAADRFDSSPALDALRSLPERQRAIAALYYLDDLSVADISDTLDIAEGTVRFHLSQARAGLRAGLGIDIDAGADRG
jgi:RNA polymerase sigma-70 factor, ECF subfamily